MSLDLLKSQRNATLKAIKDSGFSPVEFEWFETPSKYGGDAHAIAHKHSKYYFVFDHFPGDGYHSSTRVAVYAPGRENLSAYRECDSWEDMLNVFKSWLSYVKRETTEPDLWEMVEEADFEQFTGDPLSKFNKQEIALVAKGLKRVELFLIEKVADDQKAVHQIRSDVAYLVEQSKKQTRKDWANIFKGILAQYAIQLGLQSDEFKHLLKLVFGAVKTITGV